MTIERVVDCDKSMAIPLKDAPSEVLLEIVGPHNHYDGCIVHRVRASDAIIGHTPCPEGYLPYWPAHIPDFNVRVLGPDETVTIRNKP